MKFNSDPAEYSLAPAAESPAPVDPLFSFRSYQRDDIARAAMHDGAIIAWDPGLGKTMALFTFFMVKRARRVLIVAPGGLHEQIMDEGKKFFGLDVKPLRNQEDALGYMRSGILPFPGQEDPDAPLPDMPEYFITAYNHLGYNGGDEWSPEDPNELIRNRRFVIGARLMGFTVPQKNFKKGDTDPHIILGIHAKASADQIEEAWSRLTRMYDPAAHPGDAEIAFRSAAVNEAFRKLTGLQGEAHDETFSDMLQMVRKDPAHLDNVKKIRSIEAGIGTENNGIRCVFKPTLCSLIKTLFDGVTCDEAVRLKSGTAYQADGVLRMETRYRLALTGTPIKNKLPDLFFLASFVTGHTRKATARWPYGNGTADRAQFASDFGVWEENLTKQEKAREDGKRNIPRGRTDPTRICNIHRLWRVIGPVIIRRRKDDVPGCDIVKKTFVPVRVMPGTEQQRVYGYQLVNPPPHKTDLAELGHQLQCLRQTALFPASESLYRPGCPAAQSTQRFTPKSAGIMQLGIDLMLEGEQLVVFSPFQDFGQDLSDRFTRIGLPHLNLDGKITPAKRGSLIKRFKSGEIPILIAGIESMGEGHSLDCASNLVLPSLSWAFDKNSQAVERVHRLTSRKPVTVYIMVTKNTIDERLTAIWQDKGDSNDLALDARLVETEREEIDLGQLLRDAVADFDAEASTLDEAEVEARWDDTLAPSLREAYAVYREKRHVIPDTPVARPVKPLDARPATPTPTPVATIKTNTPEPAPLAKPARPMSLFEIMKMKRNKAEPAPAPEPTPAPVDKDPVRPISKIIPFPGRLGNAQMPPKKPVAVSAALG